MTVAASATPFVGRVAEVEALRADLASVCSGVSGLLVVPGDAGIGRTVLIEHVLADEPDLIRLRATGKPWQALVVYGVVDQFVRDAGVSTARLVSGDRSDSLRALPFAVHRLVEHQPGRATAARPHRRHRTLRRDHAARAEPAAQFRG